MDQPSGSSEPLDWIDYVHRRAQFDDNWPYTCSMCEMKFEFAIELKRHENEAHVPQFMQLRPDCRCFDCPGRKLFSSRNELNWHRIVVHNADVPKVPKIYRPSPFATPMNCNSILGPIIRKSVEKYDLLQAMLASKPKTQQTEALDLSTPDSSTSSK